MQINNNTFQNQILNQIANAANRQLVDNCYSLSLLGQQELNTNIAKATYDEAARIIRQEADYNLNWILANSIGHDQISAGVDCSGFTVVAANYPGNRYTLPGIKVSSTSIKDDYSFEISNPDFLVPGDLIIRAGHVAIVNEINFVNGNRDINPQSANVIVIEATRGSRNQWRVMNTRTWANMNNDCESRRLIINN